jgi:hypothetical protein
MNAIIKFLLIIVLIPCAIVALFWILFGAAFIAAVLTL